MEHSSVIVVICWQLHGFTETKLIMWKYADVKNFNGNFSGKYRMLRHAAIQTCHVTYIYTAVCVSSRKWCSWSLYIQMIRYLKCHLCDLNNFLIAPRTSTCCGSQYMYVVICIVDPQHSVLTIVACCKVMSLIYSCVRFSWWQETVAIYKLSTL